MHDLIKEGRRGIFLVQESVIKQISCDSMLAFMSKFFIVRAEMLFAEGGIEYIAYSRLFDVVDAHEETPKYRVIFADDKLSIWRGG